MTESTYVDDLFYKGTGWSVNKGVKFPSEWSIFQLPVNVNHLQIIHKHTNYMFKIFNWKYYFDHLLQGILHYIKPAKYYFVCLNVDPTC